MSKFSSADTSRSFSASDRTAGPILAAQPQVRDMLINVFFFNNPIRFSRRSFKKFNRPDPYHQMIR